MRRVENRIASEFSLTLREREITISSKERLPKEENIGTLCMFAGFQLHVVITTHRLVIGELSLKKCTLHHYNHQRCRLV